MRATPLIAIALAALPLAAAADEVTDTLDSARAAYDEGDVAYAMEELTFAIQLMKGMRAGALGDYLPEPMEGWTRTIDTEGAQGLAMMGGTATRGEYQGPDGYFEITIMVDSPMLATFAGVFSNPTMMASMGEIVRVGREKFLSDEGDLTGVVGGRILVQSEGNAPDAARAHLESIDFAALQGFGG